MKYGHSELYLSMLVWSASVSKEEPWSSQSHCREEELSTRIEERESIPAYINNVNHPSNLASPPNILKSLRTD
jgi:hypothetical protein